MRNKLTVAGERGGLLNLLENEYFYLVDFDGETENDNNISSTVILGYDGDEINNAQAQPRTATLELSIKPNVNVEIAKRHILQVIKPNQTCTFYLEQDNRKIELKGMVESISMPRYQKGISLFATFHCSQPFWEDAVQNFKTLSNIDNLHYFTDNEGDMLYFPEEGIPFGVHNFERMKTFVNEGDVTIGMDIIITATGDVTNPIIYASDGTYIGVNTTMVLGDVVTITTHKGNKTITKNGENILDTIMEGSTWLQLYTGANTFNINSDDEALGNCYFELAYKQRYV